MKAIRWMVVLAVVPGLGCSDVRATARVSATDVHRFVVALHRIPAGDRRCAALNTYFDSASPGLSAYARKFDVGAREVCDALRARPAMYASVEDKLPALDSAAARIQDVYERFLALDSSAVLPDVYFVVGNGISGGTTTGWRNPIVLIGVERTGRVDHIAPTIAHELVHTQQHYPMLGALTGGPAFLRGSLLRHSIKEGSAKARVPG